MRRSLAELGFHCDLKDEILRELLNAFKAGLKEAEEGLAYLPAPTLSPDDIVLLARKLFGATVDDMGRFSGRVVER